MKKLQGGLSMNRKVMYIISFVIILLLCFGSVPSEGYALSTSHDEEWDVVIDSPWVFLTNNTFFYSNTVYYSYSYVFEDPALVIQEHYVYFGVDGPVALILCQTCRHRLLPKFKII